MSKRSSRKIELYGRKILCIDDLIASQKSRRVGFLRNCRLKKEDVIFTSAYSSALKLVEENLDIGLAIVDMRIPKNPEDRSDFNPENPGKEWGIELLERMYEKSFERDIKKIGISAYTRYDLSPHPLEKLTTAFLNKPINFDILTEEILFIVDNNWRKNFNYLVYDDETSYFLQSRAKEIKRLARRSIEDIMNIGKYLIEVKEKLGHGNFYKWIDAEFGWGDRTAVRFMSVFTRFKSVNLSDMNILPSALYELAAPSTPIIVVDEALELARKGEIVNKNVADNIKSKYKDSEQKISKNTESSLKKEVKSNDENQKEIVQLQEIDNKQEEKLLDIPSKQKIEYPKQAVLKIISTEKPAKDSWWQLGEEHQLFCGEPKAYEFFKKASSDIALVINSPPNDDYSKIPFIKSSLEFSIRSGYGDIDLDSLANGLDDFFTKTTKPQDTVVFCYLFDVKLLEVAAERGCNCIVAEPDLEKCDLILQHWREKESVKKIIS